MIGPLAGLVVGVGLSLGAAEPGSAPLPKSLGCGSETPRQAVSPEKEAIKSFERGNALAEEGRYQDAIAAYEEAIRCWDHRIFHYNLGMVLKATSSLLEAHRHLKIAIQGGPGPDIQGVQY